MHHRGSRVLLEALLQFLLLSLELLCPLLLLQICTLGVGNIAPCSPDVLEYRSEPRHLLTPPRRIIGRCCRIRPNCPAVATRHVLNPAERRVAKLSTPIATALRREALRQAPTTPSH